MVKKNEEKQNKPINSYLEFSKRLTEINASKQDKEVKKLKVEL